MKFKTITNSWLPRFGVGFVIGLIIAMVENSAFGSEVSPILIVAMLFIATALVGISWGKKGWLAAVIIWIAVPLPHLFKHTLSLPDTLHPNTYLSILLLAAFTLAISLIGIIGGIIVRKFTVDAKKG